MKLIHTAIPDEFYTVPVLYALMQKFSLLRRIMYVSLHNDNSYLS